MSRPMKVRRSIFNKYLITLLYFWLKFFPARSIAFFFLPSSQNCADPLTISSLMSHLYLKWLAHNMMCFSWSVTYASHSEPHIKQYQIDLFFNILTLFYLDRQWCFTSCHAANMTGYGSLLCCCEYWVIQVKDSEFHHRKRNQNNCK